MATPPKVAESGIAHPHLLEVREMAVEIAGRLIVSNVTFSVDAGEILGLVGETGSGKSVSCRAVAGLIQRVRGTICDGQVQFAGRDLRRIPSRTWSQLRGREICFVPQSSLGGLDPVMTVGRQLLGAIRRLDPAARPRSRALELLELVEMPDPNRVMRSYAHELSGGMRQRALIALATAGRPRLLIADEPTSALDVTVQRAILELLAALCARERMALVIVTHDLGVIEAISHRLAVLYAGMTVELGLTAEVLARPQHPYTRALLGARPRIHSPVRRLTAIPGTPAAPDAWPSGCRFAPRCSFKRAECDAELPTLSAADRRHDAACLRQGKLPDA